MGRIVTAIFLLFVTGVALAHGGSLEGVRHFSHSLTPPETDYSIGYLGQIFGTVGNELQGNGSQILGKIFEIFNKGILVVGAVWLGYSTSTMVFRAAGEGSFIGQNKTTHFVLLRIAFGFALMIPSSTTGYSLIQDLFMKVVIQGVGLADQAWDAALNYMQYGGQLYVPPSTMETDTKIITAAMGSTAPTQSAASSGAFNQNSMGPALAIFQDEVCMIASSGKFNNQSWTTQTNPESYQPIFVQPTETTTQSGFINVTPGTVLFPGLGDPDTNGEIIQNFNNFTHGSAQGSSPACGAVIARDATNGQSYPLSQVNTAATNLVLNQTAFSALKQMAISMLPAAQKYVDDSNATDFSSGDQTAAINENSKTLFTAILAYTNLMTPYQTSLSNTNTESGSNAFMSNAEAAGWIMAGSFYWDLEQANKASANLSMSTLFPTDLVPPTVSQVQPLINAALDAYSSYSGPITTLWTQYIASELNSPVSAPSATSQPDSADLAGNISSSAMGQAISTIYGLSNTQAYNPIVILMNEGTSIMDTVVGIWVAAIGASVILGIATGFCMSESPASQGENAALTWLKSIIMLITTALLVPGAILAYYVPLYPFIVYIFAAIGWIAMVIEGMAAAPIVCLGVTHPEGHDFLGKAEQTLMLFLSIFVKPALMVLGLVAAMITSFVAFHMLITGFGTLMNSMSSSTSSFSGNTFLVLINIVMVLVVFGFLAMELVEQCYKLIYQVPNNILRWIGGPMTGEDYGAMAKGVQGVVGTAARSTGEMGAKLDEALVTPGFNKGYKEGRKLGGASAASQESDQDVK